MSSDSDPHIKKLRDFFHEHPVWVEAASCVKDGANSQVFFSHVSGEWHLMRRDGQSFLETGPAPDPDLAFRFTPGAVDRITAVDGTVGDFAVELFTCVTGEDPDQHVELRVLSPFGKLLKRGYVQVLLRGGPRVLQFAASRGVHTLADLRRLLKQLQSGSIDPTTLS